MARSHIAAALAIASLGLFVTWQLISQFGLPNIGFYHFHYGTGDVATAPNQIPLTPPQSQSIASEDGPQYLLGTGKADITGYAPANRHHIGKLTIRLQACR